MRSVSLKVYVWEQESKSPDQVWRCSIDVPSGTSVLGLASNEWDAMESALGQLMPEHLCEPGTDVHVG